MKKIITAIGNEILNKKLKKENDFEVIIEDGFEPVYLYVGSQPEGCGDDERSECIC